MKHLQSVYNINIIFLCVVGCLFLGIVGPFEWGITSSTASAAPWLWAVLIPTQDDD